MRLLSLAVLCLVSTGVGAFSQYSYLLAAPQVDTLGLWILPLDCSPFVQTPFPTIAPGVSYSSGFEGAWEEIVRAREDYLAAQVNGKAQRLSRQIFPYTVQDVALSRLYSRACFEKGLDSLTHSIEADRQALQALTKDTDALEFAAGSKPNALARGVLGEISASRKDIEGGNAAGTSFGSQWLRSINSIGAVEAAFRTNRDSAGGAIVSAIDRLVGMEWSALALTLAFDNRTRAGLGYLLDGWDAAVGEWDEAKARARFSLKEIEQERLDLIDESAFLLVGSGAVISTESNITSFSQVANDARNALDEADGEYTEAQKAFTEGSRGYASKALEGIRRALDIAGQVQSSTERAKARSRELEGKLRTTVNDEAVRLERFATASLSSNPQAAAYAADALESFEKGAQDKSLTTRGARVEFYARSIIQLRRAREWLADADRFVGELDSKLKGDFETLNQDIERAKRDDIPVADLGVALQRLGATFDSLSTLPQGERAGAMLDIERTLANLSDTIYARAAENYQQSLERMWNIAKPVASLLSSEWQSRLGKLEVCFANDGAVDIARCLGSLKQTHDTLSEAVAEINTLTPALLKRHLEENANIRWSLPVVMLDEPVDAEISVTLENHLSIRLPTGLELDLPSLAGVTADVREASQNLTYSDGKVFLSDVQGEQSIKFTLAWRGVIARLSSREQHQVGPATIRSVRRETVLRFETSQPSTVKVDFATPYPADLSASSLQPISVQAYRGTSSRLESLVQAGRGPNEVTVVESVSDPFKVDVVPLEGPDNQSVRLRVALQATAVDLEDVRHTYIGQLPCSAGSKVQTVAQDGGTVEGSFLGDSLVLKLRADRLSVGAPLSFDVLATCDNLASVAQGQLELAKAMLANATADASNSQYVQDAAKAIQNAQDALQNGDVKRAMPLVYQANDLLRKGQEQATKEELTKSQMSSQLVLTEEGLRKMDVLGGIDGAFAESLQKLSASLDKAKGLFTSGQYAKAQELLDSIGPAQFTIAAQLRQRLDSLSTSCTYDGCDRLTRVVRNAQMQIASGNWKEVVAAYEQAQKLKSELLAGQEVTVAKAGGLFERYPDLADGFEKARGDFERAFQATPEQATALRGYSRYARAQRAMQDGASDLKWLAKAWEAWQAQQGKALEKFPMDVLTSRVEGVAADTQELIEAVAAIGMDAQTELASAKQRNATVAQLEPVDAAVQEGHSFTAWVLAKGAGWKEGNPPLTGGSEGFPWLLGLVAAAILISLAWVFSRGERKSELREVD